MLLSVIMTCKVYAQPANDPNKRYRIVNGILKEIIVDSTIVRSANDTLSVIDSTAVTDEGPILKDVNLGNPLEMEKPDTTLTKAEKRELRRLERADTSYVRYSSIFRDTIPISRVSAISVVVPGFAQLYNKQAWKIPILYATVGTAATFGFKQNSKYKVYKNAYDAMIRRNASREELEPVQENMINYNTKRTALFVGAIASYVYFIADGALHYNGPATNVKKATTLSTICPGLGQIYNKSYWKVPIIIGGFATMAYIIDFNSRGYKRMKLAYDIVTDGDPNTVDEFNGRYTADNLKNLKNAYRRNRDLSIIATCGLYLLNIIDAHVDAHLQEYDISDDLAINVFPTLINYHTATTTNTTTLGLALKINF